MTTRGPLQPFRNVDDLHEADHQPPGRLGGLVLASLGGACLVFAGLALVRRPAPAVASAASPLDALVAPAASTPRDLVAARDVTFPGLLSDDPHPTTALATLPVGTAAPNHVAPGPSAAPPAALDHLSVVPLPGQRPAEAQPDVPRPVAPVALVATESKGRGALAEEGHSGAYLLQVSSFRQEPSATAFATTLRERGHHAYVESAQLAERGTWYRVRVGPFKSAREALQYRAEFERKDHIVPFLVEAEKEKRLAEAHDVERHIKITPH